VNPLLVIAAAAAAFYLGQEYLRRKAEGTLPWQQPKQLPPLSSEVPTSPEGAANLQLWASVGYGVDLFPATAQRQWLEPPPEDGISVAPKCSAIAIGHGTWQRIGARAQAIYADRNDDQIVDDALLEFLPQLEFCIAENAAAFRTFKAELRRRIAAGRIVILQFIPPPGGIQINPHGGRRRRTGSGRQWR
jgi:hypothetical protein